MWAAYGNGGDPYDFHDVIPAIGRYLLPPCTLRDMADALPKCPEGERYCGVKVWRLDLGEFQRIV